MPSQSAPFARVPQDAPAVRPLAIVADDLTGACDAAIAFVPVCREVRVELRQRTGPAKEGVSAFSTGSRHVPMAYAQAVVSAAWALVPPEVELFKKVDSVFRGNTLAEIAAVARGAGGARMVIAPAYPEMGRRVSAGCLEVRNAGWTRSLELARELECWLGAPPALVPAGHESEQVAERMRQVESRGQRVLLFDTTEQEHLDAIVAAVRAVPRRTIWVGSGGLAHALAASWPRLSKPAESMAHRTGPAVFLIGSDHPVMREQVLHLEHVNGVRSRICGEAAAGSGAMLLSVERGRTTENEIRAALPSRVGCLFLSGGDTARQVCSALDIAALRLEREFAPGVPLAIAEGGPFEGTPVLLKSGGFGERDLLCRVMDAFAPAADEKRMAVST